MGARPVAIRTLRLMGARRGHHINRGEGRIWCLSLSPRTVFSAFLFTIYSVTFLHAQPEMVPSNDPAGAAAWVHQSANLSERITKGSTEAKRSALAEIRNLRSERASRLAIPALTDREEIVRATAAGSVVFLPPADAASVLVPLLNDRAEFVRREAAFALGEAGDASATAPLLRLLEREKEIETRSE